jgi:hypothetical protein
MVDERQLVDHAPTRGVEKIRGRLHAAERVGIDQLFPTTVTTSRCPRALARRTQKPFSALW